MIPVYSFMKRKDESARFHYVSQLCLPHPKHMPRKKDKSPSPPKSLRFFSQTFYILVHSRQTSPPHAYPFPPSPSFLTQHTSSKALSTEAFLSTLDKILFYNDNIALFNLNENVEYLKILSLKFVYIESITSLALYKQVSLRGVKIV